ncbi:MAG: hypothetical protein C0506_14240 [Anaerolinea sp.]|nr:hypothetical protein [Anaerolinea sp.]
MWDGSHDMGWWAVVWMTLASFTWVGLVAFLVYALGEGFGRNRGYGTAKPVQGTPLEIAGRRYASGELGEEEFRRIRDNLR